MSKKIGFKKGLVKIGRFTDLKLVDGGSVLAGLLHRLLRLDLLVVINQLKFLKNVSFLTIINLLINFTS